MQQATGSRVDSVFRSCFPGNGPTLAANLIVDLLTDLIIKGGEESEEGTGTQGADKSKHTRQVHELEYDHCYDMCACFSGL